MCARLPFYNYLWFGRLQLHFVEKKVKIIVPYTVHAVSRLMFRVANVRNSQLLESHFKAILLGNIVTREGRTFR
jgi:hypothetical protein